MLNNAAQELIKTPIASIGALFGVAGFFLALILAVLQRRQEVASLNPGAEDEKTVSVAADARPVILCVILTPVIASTFATLTSVIFSVSFVAGMLSFAAFSFLATAITSVLGGAILHNWVHEAYHERTVDKKKIGFIGPTPYSDFNSSIGFTFAQVTWVTFSLLNCERIYGIVYVAAGGKDNAAYVPAFFATAILLGFSGLLILAMEPLARFLFRTHVKLY